MLGGTYLEFGVYSGTTFNLALITLGSICNHFYAFDSFQGMPEAVGIDKSIIW